MTMKITTEKLEFEFEEIIKAVREKGCNLKIIQFEGYTFLGMDYPDEMLLLVLRKNNEFYSMNAVYVDLTDNTFGEFFSISEILNQDIDTTAEEIINAISEINQARITVKNIQKKLDNRSDNSK